MLSVQRVPAAAPSRGRVQASAFNFNLGALFGGAKPMASKAEQIEAKKQEVRKRGARALRCSGGDVASRRVRRCALLCALPHCTAVPSAAPPAPPGAQPLPPPPDPAQLLDAIAPLRRGLTADEEQREEIDALASQLERLNPTRSPLASPLVRTTYVCAERV